MEKMKRGLFLVSLVALTFGDAQAGDFDWDDIWAPYTQRTDKMTGTSGNASNVNAATHIRNPWPAYVHDRRIPGNAARMGGAIERYRNPLIAGGLQQPPVPSPAIQNSGNGTENGEAGGSGQNNGAGQQ